MTDITNDTIVVGVDGTPKSRTALQWAIAEARRSGRSLLLAHVWHWSTDTVHTPLSLHKPLDARKDGAAILRREAARARREGVPVFTRLLEGSAPNELVKLADSAAMLVLGPRPRRGLTRALFGSVSREAVLRARCPVVLIPADQSTDRINKVGARASAAASR